VAGGQWPVASPEALLEQAALGRIGVDRRLVQTIIDSGDAEAVLRFARSSHDQERIDLDPLIVDLLRHFNQAGFVAGAIDYFVDIIRRDPIDIPDELVEAILPFAEKAVGPLIELYEEVGEEQGEDIAFLIAGLGVREERVLALLLERLEYDAADGAFCLGLYGDPAARPALEKMLAEVPSEDKEEVELRREIAYAIDQLEASPSTYQPVHFDVLSEYPAHAMPAFDLLPEAERLEMLGHDDPKVRAGAAYSFFNSTLNSKSKAALLERTKSDDDAAVRARSWEALADVADERAIGDLMISVMKDPARDIVERGGAAVGLYALGDRDDVKSGFETLYEMGGPARIKALEAMWRSLYVGYANYFAPHLDDSDPKLVREALRGAGYFRLTSYADKIAKYFDAEEPFDNLRDDALFAYAIAMPGETTRGRVRGMLRKIDSLATLTPYETELVQFGLDERLRLHGLKPVFSAQAQADEEEAPEPVAAPVPAGKIGRNDPCPCGSGKKYKKCHGG
jgi:HEAT repeat protein